METLSSILNKGCLEKGRVIAGKGNLDVKIKGISFLRQELLTETCLSNKQDIFPKGGLLFVESFSSVCATQDLIRIIQELSTRNISGIVFRPASSLYSISSEVINVADQLEFPLIELHTEDNISKIFNELLGAIDKDNLLMEKIYMLSKSFSEIALTDGEIEEIGQNLANFCQANVRIDSIFKETLAEVSTAGVNLEHNEKNFVSIKKEVTLNNEVNAFLTMYKFGQPINELDLMAVESAATNIAFILLRQQEAEETEKHFYYEFFNDLIDGDIQTEEEIIQRGFLYGVDLGKNYLLFVLNVLSMKDIFPKSGLKESYRLLRKTSNVVLKNFFSNFEKIIIWNRSNNLIMLYPVPGKYVDKEEEKEQEIKNISQDIAQMTKKIITDNIDHITVTVGIGKYYPGIIDIKKSYKEAMTALRLGKSNWGSNAIYHYEDLGFYKIISNYPDRVELNTYVKATLGPLIEYDKQNNTNLLYTLELLLDNCSNQAVTAKELFIHPKTLAYRKRRIQDILGISLENAETVFNIYMALKTKRTLNNDY